MKATPIILSGGDLLISLCVYLLTVSWLLARDYTKTEVLVFVVICLATAFFAELYGNIRKKADEILIRIVSSMALAFCSLLFLSAVVPQISFQWPILVPSLALIGVLQYAWHLRCQGILSAPLMTQKTLILGTGNLAQDIRREMDRVKSVHRFAGYIRASDETWDGIQEDLAGSTEDLSDIIQNKEASNLVIALRQRRGQMPVKEILRCKLKGVQVIDGLDYYERLTGKLMIERTNYSWFIYSDGFRLTSFMRLHKRMFDIFWALIGITLSLPIYPFVILAIKIDSPGPIFFRQKRVGLDEEEFEILKFRTMVQDAEKKSGAVWAQKNDPRITRLGNFLRKTRIDELPQLFNVLHGDMSFIGPRPERMAFVTELNEQIPFYAKRHFVKPGITGWAQVRYPYGASVEDAKEKLKYDLYYIKNYSIFLDLMIISETIKVVLFGRGR